MKLKSILLDNFRSHKKLETEFKGNINILVGKNASGKTNILEAIFFLATTKSHRTAVQKELINRDNETFFIRGEAERSGGSFTLEMGCSRNGRRAIKLNHQPVRARKDVVGQLPVVFFSPEDLYLVKENPSHRRKFLDIFISQIDRRYMMNLQKYQKAIQERNRALAQVREGSLKADMLDVWDEQIIKPGAGISARRTEVVLKLNDICSEIHRQMTAGVENISFQYCTGSGSEEDFRKALEKNRRVEIDQAVTMSGPHRDDILIFSDGISLRQFGSQGQQRTAALSLKLGELELMKDVIGEYPLILFDDVMSELDEQRQRFFLEIIGRTGYRDGGIQSFITATEIGPFESIKDSINVIEVEKLGTGLSKGNLKENAG